MPTSHPICVTECEPDWSCTYTNPLYFAGAALGPKEYAAFLREQLAALKAAEPELAHRDRVRRAAAAWRDWKRAVRKAERG
jgi:hypothetical protein